MGCGMIETSWALKKGVFGNIVVYYREFSSWVVVVYKFFFWYGSCVFVF